MGHIFHHSGRWTPCCWDNSLRSCVILKHAWLVIGVIRSSDGSGNCWASAGDWLWHPFTETKDQIRHHFHIPSTATVIALTPCSFRKLLSSSFTHCPHIWVLQVAFMVPGNLHAFSKHIRLDIKHFLGIFADYHLSEIVVTERKQMAFKRLTQIIALLISRFSGS